MNLILFFTYKTSMKDWIDNGLFSREVLLYKKLVESGVNVTFVSYDDIQFDDELSPHGIRHLPFYSSEINKKNNSFFIFNLIKFFYKNKALLKNADIFKTNQMLGSWLGIISKFLYKKPLIIRTGYDLLEFSIQNKKNLLKKIMYYFLTLISLSYSDFYSVTSKSDKDLLLKRFGSRNIHLRPNWIDVNSELKITQRENYTFLSVGRLEKQKNYKNIILQLSNSNYKYHIYGEGAEKSKLLELGKKNNVNLNIYNRIENVDLLEKYSLYKFYLIPSFFEGNPKSMLEAMSKGCIVIASDIPNHREIIQHGKNGFLFDYKNNNLVSFLDKIMNENSIDLEKISKEAHQTILKNNSIDKYTIQELEDYKSII